MWFLNKSFCKRYKLTNEKGFVLFLGMLIDNGMPIKENAIIPHTLYLKTSIKRIYNNTTNGYYKQSNMSTCQVDEGMFNE